MENTKLKMEKIKNSVEKSFLSGCKDIYGNEIFENDENKDKKYKELIEYLDNQSKQLKTIVGGIGEGMGENQLKYPNGIFVDMDKNVYKHRKNFSVKIAKNSLLVVKVFGGTKNIIVKSN